LSSTTTAKAQRVHPFLTFAPALDLGMEGSGAQATKVYSDLLIHFMLGGSPITEKQTIVHTVSDVVFFEYCNWYEPNSQLQISLASINETAVENKLTTSLTATIGPEWASLSASVTKETSTTVTNSKGITVAQTYELTQYDQTKNYKVILKGNYTVYKYEYFHEGHSYSSFQLMEVDQDSLTVQLVHN
jgi:hypothetical protein